jgi:hypothetical protein
MIAELAIRNGGIKKRNRERKAGMRERTLREEEGWKRRREIQ